MIDETVFPMPPPLEGSTPSPAGDPIGPDNPINSDYEPKTASHDERTSEGSAGNAVVHGCAGSGRIKTRTDQAEAQRQHQMLRDTYHPQTDYEDELLAQIANERTLQKRCQSNLFALTDSTILAAELHWDLDQAIAAQELATGLTKAPSLVRLQLSQTPQGATILEDFWTRLGGALAQAGGWTHGQRHLALDLLGVPSELRVEGQTEVDAKPGEDPRAVAQAIVERQLQGLRAAYPVECRQKLDHLHRLMALSGDPVKISRDVRLMKRYEAMHARRAAQAMAEFERVRSLREQTDLEHKSRTVARLAGIRLKEQQAADHAAGYGKSVPPAPASAPAAPAAAVAAAAPVARATRNGSTPKPSMAGPSWYRDRDKERAEKKAEREARKKQRKQR